MHGYIAAVLILDGEPALPELGADESGPYLPPVAARADLSHIAVKAKRTEADRPVLLAEARRVDADRWQARYYSEKHGRLTPWHFEDEAPESFAQELGAWKPGRHN